MYETIAKSIKDYSAAVLTNNWKIIRLDRHASHNNTPLNRPLFGYQNENVLPLTQFSTAQVNAENREK